MACWFVWQVELHKTGSIFESSASDVHGIHPPSQPVVLAPSPHLGFRPAHTRKAVSPVHHSLSTRPARWNHGIVPLQAPSSIPIHIDSAAGHRTYTSSLLTLISFSLPVSKLCTRLLAPAPASRLAMDQTTDSDSHSHCCLPACIFTIPSSPLLFDKVDRGTCIPCCAFLVSKRPPPNPPRSIYSLPPTTSRVLIP